MRVKWYLSDFHACGHVRGEVVAREINKSSNDTIVDCKADVMISDFHKTDAMVFQRQWSRPLIDKAKLAKNVGIKVIYEIDDDLLNTPVEFIEPYKFHAKPEVRAGTEWFLKNADAITASTMPLAESTRRYTHNVPIYVVENSVDIESWEKAYALKQTKPDEGVVTIGWMASGSHTIDSVLVERALPNLMKKYSFLKIHLIGLVNTEIFPQLKEFGDRVKSDPWTDINILPYAMADFDIGVCPLIRSAYNDCKSNIKWQQNACLAIPSIVSAGPVYGNVKDLEDGIVVQTNSPEEWEHKLSQLIEDETLRKKIGCSARKTVLDLYDIRNNWGNWVDVYKKIVR